MKFSYKFSNLLGTVYRQGDLLFTPDGNSVISPVGNRITIYDLKNNKSNTLPVESRFNYTALALSPNGITLIAVNEAGDAHMISLISQTIVHRYRFKKPVSAIKFSPDGKYFAACKENNVFIFRAPGGFTGEYNAFIMERVYHGAFDSTTCLDWTTDSKILAVGSKDMSTKLYSLQKWNLFRPYSLGSHTDAIVSCFFEKNSLDITTVSRNGQVCVWACNINLSDLIVFKSEPDIKKQRVVESDSEDDVINPIEEKQISNLDVERQNDFLTSDATVQERDEKGKIVKKNETAEKNQFFYKRLARHYLADEVRKSDIHATLTAAVYHRETKILVTGFSNGCFFLHELPDVNMIHSLSVSDQSITALSINSSGDWLALGCAGLGQLLVWEWQSEQYVMKQQGHSSNMSCLCYIPNTDFIVTGGLDGKIKLWNTATGFCVVTFDEHSSAITQVEYCPSKKFFVSASLDGTVRAFDIKRYSNFKTFASPRPIQFSCVAVDTSGKLVCAGGQDVFEIYLWAVDTRLLLEVLSGHEGPVVSIAFSPLPESTSLVSASWDRTVRLWNALETSSQNEPILLQSDALCVTYNPNGEQVAVSTLNGYITVFDVKTSDQLYSIEGREDLGSGRSDADLVTAQQSLRGKAFSTLCYSADGECILAGGQSKNVCIYNISKGILLRKFEITQNRSLDAVDDFINRRKMCEFGNLALVEERENGEGGNVSVRLPGVKSGDMASRSFKPEIRVLSIQFSPDGHSWAACTTEGLLIYSLNTGMIFSPFLLDMSTTCDSTREALKDEEYTLALMRAAQLNEKDLLLEVLEQIPVGDIKLIITQLPKEYALKIVNFLTVILAETPHIQFFLMWLSGLLEHLGPLGKNGIPAATLIALDRDLSRKYEQHKRICDFNKFTIEWIQQLGAIKAKSQRDQTKEANSNGLNLDSASSEEEYESDEDLMLID